MDEEKRWVDYLRGSIVETVIGKDILLQARVKSPTLFRQAFYLVMSHPARVVSYNKLLGQLQDKGNINVVKYYIELLEGAFLVKAIHKYSKTTLRKLSSSPKLVPLAPALSCFAHQGELGSEYLGHVFEATVGSTLLRNDFELFYWAEGQAEIDFVLEYGRTLIGIEVKSGRQRHSQSIDRFLAAHPKAKIVYITKENFLEFTKNPAAFFDKFL